MGSPRGSIMGARAKFIPTGARSRQTPSQTRGDEAKTVSLSSPPSDIESLSHGQPHEMQYKWGDAAYKL